jgi:hypothetical protein
MNINTIMNLITNHANANGHTLKWSGIFKNAQGVKCNNATCKKCGRFVAVNEESPLQDNPVFDSISERCK